LVPEDVRPDDGREAGEAALLADICRHLRHVLPDALPGDGGRAAPVLLAANVRFPPRVVGSEHVRLARGIRARPRAAHLRLQLYPQPVPRAQGAGKSLAREHPGVAGGLAVWLLVGALTVLFAAFTSAYLVRGGEADRRVGPRPPVL